MLYFYNAYSVAIAKLIFCWHIVSVTMYVVDIWFGLCKQETQKFKILREYILIYKCDDVITWFLNHVCFVPTDSEIVVFWKLIVTWVGLKSQLQSVLLR